MNIGVGSQNKTKIEAVRQAFLQVPMFADSEIEGVNVQIDEFGHPKTMEETIAGAIDRAKQAFVGHDLGVGIESGLMAVPQTKTGYMEVAVCAMYDGAHIHLGFSQAYEWPKKVLDKIVHEGLDGSQAMKAAGITDKQKLGEHEGFVGVMTKGRMDRTDFNRGAVVMALILLENAEHYS